MFRTNSHSTDLFIWASGNEKEDRYLDKIIQEREWFGTLHKLHIFDENGNDVTKKYIERDVKTLHEIYTK